MGYPFSCPRNKKLSKSVGDSREKVFSSFNTYF